jgi:hypothetical protein
MKPPLLLPPVTALAATTLVACQNSETKEEIRGIIVANGKICRLIGMEGLQEDHGYHCMSLMIMMWRCGWQSNYYEGHFCV